MRLSTCAVMPASFSLSRDYASTRARKRFACFAARFDRFVHLLVADGIDVAEAEVFEFAANFAHAEAVRDGRVDVERLAGNFLLALGREVLERAHVVQAVGEFDEDDANVVHHGQHHLAQVFGLLLFAGGEVDFADLGDALDDVRDLLAEFLADVDDRDRGVFDRIMQQAGGDGDGIHLHFGQHQRDFERMDEVGLAGGAGLSGVMLLGKFVGFADELQIVVGAVGSRILLISSRNLVTVSTLVAICWRSVAMKDYSAQGEGGKGSGPGQAAPTTGGTPGLLTSATLPPVPGAPGALRSSLLPPRTLPALHCPERTSPTAKTPGRLVSSICGARAGPAGASVVGIQIPASQDEAFVVERDAALQPLGARGGTGHDKHVADVVNGSLLPWLVLPGTFSRWSSPSRATISVW